MAIVGDHGYPQNRTAGGGFDGGGMRTLAEELDAEWKPKGTHVFYVPTYLEHNEAYMREMYGKLGVKTEIAAIDDASEALYLEAVAWKVDAAGSVLGGSEEVLDGGARQAVGGLQGDHCSPHSRETGTNRSR